MKKDDSINQNNHPDVLTNILLFRWNWEVNFSRRIENAEMIGSYYNKKECLNYILNCLANSYVEHTIELILNQFYQVVKLIQKYDTNFRYVPNESDPVGLLMEYRNKLIAHAIENKISGDSAKYAQLLKMWPRIFRDIEAGVEKIYKWMDRLQGIDHTVTARLHPTFEIDHLIELLRIAPNQVALEDILSEK